MLNFVTWMVEYSDDDPLAMACFIASLPMLMLAKFVLFAVDSVTRLFSGRRESELIGVRTVSY